MKRYIMIFAVIALSAAAFGLSIKAKAGKYYTYNKALCAKYLILSHQAFKNKDYGRAKLFARKAIQSDVFNRNAWEDYDLIVAKLSGGKSKHLHHISVKSKSTPKAAHNNAPAPSGGGAFVGC